MPDRREKIVAMARATYGDDYIVIDDNAKLSEGDDNDTWVQAWVWVDLSGSEFDKDPGEDEAPE